MVAWLGWSHAKCFVYWTEFLNGKTSVSKAIQFSGTIFSRIENIIYGQFCFRSSDVKDLTNTYYFLYIYIYIYIKIHSHTNLT